MPKRKLAPQASEQIDSVLPWVTVLPGPGSMTLQITYSNFPEWSPNGYAESAGMISWPETPIVSVLPTATALLPQNSE